VVLVRKWYVSGIGIGIGGMKVVRKWYVSMKGWYGYISGIGT
jgi:hypothetical protein